MTIRTVRKTVARYGLTLLVGFIACIVVLASLSSIGVLPYRIVRTPDSITDVVFSGNGKYLAFGTRSWLVINGHGRLVGQLYILNSSNLVVVQRIDVPSSPGSITSTGADGFLVAPLLGPNPFRVNPRRITQTFPVNVMADSLPVFQSGPNGDIVYQVPLPTTKSDGMNFLTQVAPVMVSNSSGHEMLRITGRRDKHDDATSLDGKYVAIDESDHLGQGATVAPSTAPYDYVDTYDLTTGSRISSRGFPGTGIVASSPDGKIDFEFSQFTGVVNAWNTETQRILWSTHIPDYKSPYLSLCTSPDKKLLALSSMTNVILIDANCGKIVQKSFGFPGISAIPGANLSSSFSPDSRILATRGNRCIYFWHAPKGD